MRWLKHVTRILAEALAVRTRSQEDLGKDWQDIIRRETQDVGLIRNEAEELAYSIKTQLASTCL